MSVCVEFGFGRKHYLTEEFTFQSDGVFCQTKNFFRRKLRFTKFSSFRAVMRDATHFNSLQIY